MGSAESTFAGPLGWRLREGSRCAGCEPLDYLDNGLSALHWLRSLNLDPAFGEVRGILLRFNVPVHRLDRHGALNQLSFLLGSGRVHVCRRSIEEDKVRFVAAGKPTAAAPPPFPLSESRQRAKPPAEPAPEMATFAHAVDARAIHEGMKEAAQLGTPFCEECAKAAQAGRS